MNKYLVLSDLHFGTNQTSMNNQAVVKGLEEYIENNGPWESVIFSGDLLDLNLSIFKYSIEGRKKNEPAICGFRDFITGLYKHVVKPASKLSVANWVYIPGNHDYAIWNMLSTKEMCMDVLARGESLKPGPKMEGKWKGNEAFISGIFPQEVREKVSIEYPDYVIPFGNNNGKIIVTHGHYLDFKQTFFNNLDKLTKEEEIKEKVRSIFIETAQYQTLAQAVSYTPGKRTIFDHLFGPNNPLAILEYVAHNIFNAPLRGKPIDEDLLRAIEIYLGRFRNYAPLPDYFIFGHTHSPGKASTGKIKKGRLYDTKDINIFNAGSFFPGNGIAGSFVTIETTDDNEPVIEIWSIDKNGNIALL